MGGTTAGASTEGTSATHCLPKTALPYQRTASPMPHTPCPMPHAPCPIPDAPCPITQCKQL
ncbi:hypothetical protein [Tolypothrix sp. VBCCA 56010]|uniref:hypothetical protein n=1 Tax=Tolypothrix sp. VBCCA 56010 TaxID=3137731 RepID=UPI003D7E1C2D